MRKTTVGNVILSRRLRLKGFTLPEIMIGSALGAAVVLGGAMVIAKLQKSHTIDVARHQLLQKSARVLEQFRTDVSNAIRVTGHTADGNISRVLGVARCDPYSVTGMDAPTDCVTVLVDLFSIASIPGVRWDNSLHAFKVNKPNGGLPLEAYNAFLNIRGSFSQANNIYMILTRADHHHAFPSEHMDSSVGANYFTMSPPYLRTIAQKYRDEMASDDSVLTFAVRIKYSVNSSGELIRVDEAGQPRVIAKNVEKFKVSFRFGNYAGEPAVTVDSGYYASPLKYVSVDGSGAANNICKGESLTARDWTHCPDYPQTSMMKVDFEIAKPGTYDAKYLQDASSQGFRVGGDEIVYNAVQSMVPFGFEGTKAIQSEDYSLSCDPANAASRCQPTCADAYNNPTSGTADWVGYKNGSPWCTCAETSAGHYNPDFEKRRIRHNAKTADGRRRLEACFQTFGCAYKSLPLGPGESMSPSAGDWWDFNEDYDLPEVYAACVCTQDDLENKTLAATDNADNARPDQPGYLASARTRFTQSADARGKAGVLWSINGPIVKNESLTHSIYDLVDPLMSDARDRNVVCNTNAWKCKEAFQAIATQSDSLHPGGASATDITVGGTLDPYKICQECTVFYFNSRGERIGNLLSYEIDWPRVCHGDGYDGKYPDKVCTNTGVTTGGVVSYKRTDYDDHADPLYNFKGLDMWSEVACRCFDQALPQQTSSLHWNVDGWTDWRDRTDQEVIAGNPYGLGALPLYTLTAAVKNSSGSSINTNCDAYPWGGGAPISSAAMKPRVGSFDELVNPPWYTDAHRPYERIVGIADQAAFEARIHDPAHASQVVPTNGFDFIQYCAPTVTFVDDTFITKIRAAITGAPFLSDLNTTKLGLPLWCGGITPTPPPPPVPQHP